MPKSTRDELKHNCARAIKHLITTSDYITDTIEVFEPTHPEQAKELADIIPFIGASVTALTIFLEKTWAISENNIHKWM